MEREGIVCMCTGFVRKGNDVIVGFNMDINIGAFEYDVYTEPDKFYIGIKNQMKVEDMAGIPEGLFRLDNNVRKAHGVNCHGCFGNMLNNMNFDKAPFCLDPAVISLDQLMDDYISGLLSFQELQAIADDKEIVNIPTGPIQIPDLAFHSLVADKEGHIMILEPGNGYSIIKEKYAVLSNFPFLELPADFTQDKFGYYGKDRYDIAMEILRNSTDDFSVQEGLALLKAVKQEGNWATRVSFVYSASENAVYYALERDFEHVRKHTF